MASTDAEKAMRDAEAKRREEQRLQQAFGNLFPRGARAAGMGGASATGSPTTKPSEDAEENERRLQATLERKRQLLEEKKQREQQQSMSPTSAREKMRQERLAAAKAKAAEKAKARLEEKRRNDDSTTPSSPLASVTSSASTTAVDDATTAVASASASADSVDSELLLIETSESSSLISNEQLEALQERIDKLLDEQREQHEQIAIERAAWQRERDQFEKHSEQQREQRDKLEHQLSIALADAVAKSDVIATLSATNARLSTDTTALTADVTRLTSEVARLSSEVARLSSDATAQLERLRSVEAEKTKLAADLEAASSELITERAVSQQLEQEIDSLNRSITEKRSNDDSATTIDELQQRIKQLTTETVQLKLEREAATKAARVLTDREIERLRAEHSKTLKEREDAATVERSTLESKLEALAQQIEQQREEHARLREEIETAKQATATATATAAAVAAAVSASNESANATSTPTPTPTPTSTSTSTSTPTSDTAATSSTADSTTTAATTATTATESNALSRGPAACSVSDRAKFTELLLEQVNIVRTTPSAYIPILKARIPFYNGNVYSADADEYSLETTEGVQPLLDAIKVLENQAPLQPLTLSEGLSNSLRDLVDDIGPKGEANNPEMDSAQHLVRYGQWKGKIVEIASYGEYSHTPIDVLCHWLIDDGNQTRSQQQALLYPEYRVIGISSGPHSKWEKMSIIALTLDFSDGSKDSNNASSSSSDSSDKISLVDSPDGKSFIVTTKPLMAPLSDVSLLLKGRSLQLLWSLNGADGIKKSAHQWGLPFAIPAENICATYDSDTRLTIQLLKDTAVDESEPGIAKMHEFQLPADTASPENRLKPKLQQSKTAYTFVLVPCNCDATVTVKVKDGCVLLLESVYKEITTDDSGQTTTKTITQNNTVKIPFKLHRHLLSFSEVEEEGKNCMKVVVSKPTATDSKEISIPITRS